MRTIIPADKIGIHFGFKTKLKYRLIQNMKTIGPSNRATEITKMLVKKYGPFEPVRKLKPVEELVYTILSQHTSDINSERAYKNLLAKFGSLHAVAKADTTLIANVIKSGGLNKIKAVRIKNILNIILTKLGNLDLSFLGELPLEEAKSWLKDLPGIGPKSAAVILCFSLDMPAMAVDTHVYRVSKRLQLIEEHISADASHEILEGMVASTEVYKFHSALINHGRKTCKAINPNCSDCILSDICPYPNKPSRQNSKV